METIQDVRAPGGVTIGIPVYNEAPILVPNLTRLLAHLETLGVEYEVIIGSNGSTDSTVPLGRQLERECDRVSFFHLPRRGVGLAFREIVRRAQYQALVSLDMDLSADLSFIERALRLGQADIVIGSKKLARQRRPLIRKAGSDAFLWCARLLTGLDCDDYSIGAKAYRVGFVREFIGSIDDGSSYVLDLCVIAATGGRRICCIPVNCEDRRTSKFNLLHEAAYKLRRLLVTWVACSVARRSSRTIGGLDQTAGATPLASRPVEETPRRAASPSVGLRGL